ncbi:placenta-specific gene 8 protein-like [Anneissia japonica]|uniref:placenta-specific gene 8 protein-like n=1 Tax=Anneissia japonica TaxID=1529436 RepID=UPI0014258D34|nr:placenta-specific gene 8 protein-like [Anneissia japonica]
MTTTVVTHQPGIIAQSQVVVQVTERDWSTSLFGCFEDIGSCLCGWLCYPCFACQVATNAGEHCITPCCVPGAMIALRLKVRARLNIQGSLCNDCLVDTFCGPCSACQMHREINNSSNGHLQ